MTRFPFISSLAAAALAFGCTTNVPQVSGKDPVIPERGAGPSRQAQALSSPSTADSESSSNEQAYCIGGEQTLNEYDAATGEFASEWTCDPGGGIASVRNEGVSDPNTGDGSWDQISVLENGGELVWHYTADTSEDFLTTTYEAHDDTGQTYVGVYVMIDADTYALHEEWNLHEGTYVIDGESDFSGAFRGTTVFDDPDTEQSPDWVSQDETDGQGNGTQSVHFVGEGFTSDYSVVYTAEGESSYEFETDIDDTVADPDYSGAYSYNADFSGEGGYRQNFDDGSTLDVEDVIHSDGSLDQSWVFDDASTEQSVDQEGTMHYNADGSGSGEIITHVVGGATQTCDIEVGADGSHAIDNCR